MNFKRVCDLKLWVLVLYVIALSNPHLCSARHVRDYIADIFRIPTLQAIAQYADRERAQQSVPEYIAPVKPLQAQAQNAVSDRVLSWWPWWKYSDSHNETIIVKPASPLRDNNRGDVATHLSSSNPEFPDSKDGCDFQVQGPSGLWRKYFFAHNETRIAIARAEAAASRSSQDNNRGDRFPSFPPSKDRCNWDYFGVTEWDTSNLIDELQVMAVDSCLVNGDGRFYYDHGYYGESCRQWHDSIQARDDLFRGSRSINVFVRIRILGLEILAEGVYFPVTGKMHLEGCMQDVHIPHSQGGAVGVLSGEVPKIAVRSRIRASKKHPLSSNSSSEVCAVAVTLQYPPVNPRWNSQRVLKFELRSTSDNDDPLYFDTMERTIFFPYSPKDFSTDRQRRIKAAGWVLLLVLGLVCVAMQIKHGWNNEEALPFVSLGMLGIQLIYHVSKMPIFQAFQIERYRSKLAINFGSAADLNYYETSAWVMYVPYESMTTAALFMYVFIFHNVGVRRRIMQLRVRRGRPGAKDPPSDGPLVSVTLTIFCVVVGLLGFPGYSGNTGMTSAPGPTFWEALWVLVNNVTGVMVSLFLVPQVLGNWRWKVQGRPLSAWFYVGLPFLQSLPFTFCVVKHFQLVPIFTWYDPYLNSYGFFERVLVPWWEVGVFVCSALLVLAVHFQFAAAPPLNRPSWHTVTQTPFV